MKTVAADLLQSAHVNNIADEGTARASRDKSQRDMSTPLRVTRQSAGWTLDYPTENQPTMQERRHDPVFPVQQSIGFAQVISERVASDHFELDILEQTGHDDPAFETDKTLARVFDFIGRHLR